MKIGYEVRELRAAALLLKGLDREVSKQINAQTKKIIGPEWKKTVTENADTPLEQQVLARTARVDVKNYGVTVRAGGGTKRLAGGGRTNELARAAEFGANREQRGRVKASGRAKAYTRRTHRQFRPVRPAGPFYKAVADITPRLAALWAQTTVRTFWEVMKRG